MIGVKPDKPPLLVDLSSLVEVDAQLHSRVVADLRFDDLVSVILLSWFSDSFLFGYKLILMEKLLVPPGVGVVSQIFVLNLGLFL